MIFAYVIEDVDLSISKQLDQKLKSELPSYLGMTKVDIESTDERKQFWKDLIRTFSIEMNVITVFRSEEDDSYIVESIAKEYGYFVHIDGFFPGFSGVMPTTQQSSRIKSYEQLKHKKGKNDSSRGILEMSFSLAKELSISGTLIWESIESINKIRIIPQFIEYISIENIYISLYYAAQGIERLLKIITEMILYKTNYKDKKHVEKLLLSHNHPALYDFIKKHYKVSSSKEISKLLQMLYVFYSEVRYSRYTYSTDDKLELKLLQNFFDTDAASDYDSQIKHHYGKTMGNLSQELYNIIYNLSHDLNIYVYEGASSPVASYVFHSYFGNDLYDTLLRIEKSKKELLWYLIKKGDNLLASKILAELPPLELEEESINEYISDLISNKNGNYQLDSDVNTIYEEIYSEDKDKWTERLEAIDCFTKVIYEETDEEE